MSFLKGSHFTPWLYVPLTLNEMSCLYPRVLFTLCQEGTCDHQKVFQCPDVIPVAIAGPILKSAITLPKAFPGG